MNLTAILCHLPALSVYPVVTNNLRVDCQKQKNKMANFPKYLIQRSRNNQFYWELFATNGKTILVSSETYLNREGCKVGIASSKINVSDDKFKRLRSTNSEYYFHQIANNYKELGRSQMYDSAQGCEVGIAAVKKDAPIANIEDSTI